jgi:pimeloyl-ACP methyl ester carboxylesterase
MPTVKINDVNIYYESHGSGSPLVFAYGLGGNTGMWTGQMARAATCSASA